MKVIKTAMQYWQVALNTHQKLHMNRYEEPWRIVIMKKERCSNINQFLSGIVNKLQLIKSNRIGTVAQGQGCEIDIIIYKGGY